LKTVANINLLFLPAFFWLICGNSHSRGSWEAGMRREWARRQEEEDEEGGDEEGGEEGGGRRSVYS
jgi:hypothetical protein